MKELVNLENIIAGYSSGFMLKKINTKIGKGVFAGIIGPNGSGKTTLFKAICGEIPLRGGRIIINDTDTSKIHPRQRAQKMAVVSQNTEVLDITVEDYVLLGRLPYKSPFQLFDKEKDYQIVHKFLKLTDTYNFKDKLMSELSGGQQQLASIARALSQEPELLLLDEPTSHLDISHQVHILNLIQSLNEEYGLTVLMIIHDLNLASEYCNHLIMLEDGGIYTQGSPDQVLHHQHIEEVYKTIVITQQNPLSKKPAIFLVSAKVLDQNRQD